MGRAVAALALVVALGGCAAAPVAGGPPATTTPRTGEPVRTPTPPAATPTERPVFWVEAPILGDPSPLLARIPPTGAVVEGATARLLRPAVADTPRRVAIQVGHLDVHEAPAEFPSLRFQFGGTFDGIREVDVNLDIALRVEALLAERGIVVDVLPATIPPGYLADVFVSLHADGDDFREASGFKIAHGFYRTPHDAELVRILTEEYAAATGLLWADNVTDEMTDYYAFAWFRYEHALAPHTAAAIMEMGFLSHPRDRALLVERPDDAAGGIAAGIVRFLDAVSRSALFAEDIIVPIVPAP